jgi:hypothetical protein
MKLRRLKIAALAILALMAMDASNFWPMDDYTHGQARAQIPIIANGLVVATDASVSATNTTGEVLLFQYPIPAAFIASWTATNNAFGAPPMHLRLNGMIYTSSTAPTATLGVNLGGASATMTVVNGATLQASLGGSGQPSGGNQNLLSPVALDVWFNPIATLTTTSCAGLGPCQYSLAMAGRFSTASITAQNTANLATESTYNAATLGTINVLTGQTLGVFWRWGAASAQNSLNIYSGTLTLGW